jgi:hypothetical protein
MKKNRFWSILLLTLFLSMTGTKAFAYDIGVYNEDSVYICYNYINNNTELEVTRKAMGYSGTIIIPEEVTYMNRTRKVTSIGERAFSECSGLTSVTIPNSVTSIGDWAFYECSRLTNITIPNSLTSIGESVFFGCHRLTSITIPNFVTSIGNNAFRGCSSLTSVTIPNSVTSIGYYAFFGCCGLTSITIPNSVTSIGDRAFDGADISTVVSLIEEPFTINGGTFSKNTTLNATLYAPTGTIAKYKATEGWKDFVYIEEGTGPGGVTPEPQKCEKPTISYKNGKLTFSSATEGALCQYTITDEDIRTGISNEVQLGVTYRISVYATKADFNDSDVATATLCWIDSNPKSEGLEDGVANIPAQAILIQSHNGLLTIEGAEEGTAISIYDTSGRMVGSARATVETTNVSTSLNSGEVGIVKIGDRTVKVVMR